MGRVVYDTDTYDQTWEEAQENGDVTIDSYEPEKVVMTEKEKDANAGVVRDKDGNVMSEVTSGWNGNYYGKEKDFKFSLQSS